MFGMSFRFEHRLEQKQVLRLSAEQRLQIENRLFGLRMELIQALRGDRYQAGEACPSCGQKLSAAEIIGGFNQDPDDFSTACVACQRRFNPRLICFGDGTRIELPFYCAMQVLARLPGKEMLSPEEFLKAYPAIYRSAIVHHGGLCQAFAQMDIVYPFEEISGWKAKVVSFLGRLSDKMIADCVNVSAVTVGNYRRKLGISRYRKHEVLDDLEEENSSGGEEE